jgi:enoyl-CoA hydratase/carnithine racemase
VSHHATLSTEGAAQPFETFRLRHRPGVLDVTFANPPINLIDGRVRADLEGLVGQLEADETTLVVVFRSEHPDFWFNHFDLAPPGPAIEGKTTASARPLYEVYDEVARLRQVTIGEIRGATRGAGAEFALALDMRFASLERARLGQPEAGVGLHPGAGGTQRLSELVGRGRALEIMLSADDYPADLAERYGWINRAIPDAEISSFVDRLAERIARFPARGLANVKEFVNVATLPLPDVLAEESAAFRASLGDPAFQERLMWLFSLGAQRAGQTELDLGAVLGTWVPAGGVGDR